MENVVEMWPPEQYLQEDRTWANLRIGTNDKSGLSGLFVIV